MPLKIARGLFALLIFGLGISWTTTSELSATREFQVSADKLWTVWNDTSIIKKWWGPEGFSCPLAQNDPRIGGKYLLGMQQDGSTKIDYNIGFYKEFLTNKRMVSEVSFSDINGNPIPGSKVKLPGTWPDFVTVTVEFESLSDNKTRVVITETGIPLIIKFFAKLGWEQQLDKIEKLLK